MNNKMRFLQKKPIVSEEDIARQAEHMRLANEQFNWKANPADENAIFRKLDNPHNLLRL
jgi:hypothetical protein